ncbi:hypothetical protein ES708_31445 [subsurface metagenome]
MEIPPAGLIPVFLPVFVAKSRIDSAMILNASVVAAGCNLPVEVLMKSAPDSMARIDALLI